MQAILNKLTNPTRSFAAGTLVALVSVLSVCFCAAVANAQQKIVFTGLVKVNGDIDYDGDSGGWYTGASPLGGTFVVGRNGDVVFGDGYGSKTWHVTASGVQTVLAPQGNSNAAAIDGYGNIYIASGYNPNVYKIPYNAATATYTDIPVMPTANCLGGTQDTAACVFAPGVTTVLNANKGTGTNTGITALAFDAQGDLFVVSSTVSQLNPNAIYECNAQCQTETDGLGTHPPVLVFGDTVAMGGIAVDPWGNLFFTDGGSNGGNAGKVSYLKELPLSGTYASSPTVLESYTSIASYNALSGVAVGSDGTVYFSTANDGVFALPNASTGPVVSSIYQVSTQGGRAIALDGEGNLYLEVYTGLLSHDGVLKMTLNNLSLGAATVGAAAPSASGNLIDNAGGCPATPLFNTMENGVSGPGVVAEFNATAGTCSGAYGTGNGTFSPALGVNGSAFPVTLTFTPGWPGERIATISITDAANNGAGTMAVSGVGNGPLANFDPGTTTAYSTGFTTPASVVGDSSGDLFVADPGAGKVFEIAHGTATRTSIGAGLTTPAAVALDATSNVWVADSSSKNIVEIRNTATGGGFTQGGSAVILITPSVFGGTALGQPTAMAFGPDGILYITDTPNNRVVSYNPNTGVNGIRATGLNAPAGIAVDSANNLYVANQGAGNVLVFSPTGVLTATLTPASIVSPQGVAVDASGSVYISDNLSGAIVRVPNESGVLTQADTLLIEQNPLSAWGLALDVYGNLYTTDEAGNAVYAVNRSAVSYNFGAVSNGVPSNPLTIYAEVTGTTPVTVGSTPFTQPAPAVNGFTLASTVNPECTGGSQGPVGMACSLQAVFTPPTGTSNNTVLSASATFNSDALNAPAAAINLTGTAITSSVKPQSISNFAPPATANVGEQIALTATPGASGVPVVFTIDPSSACKNCANINENTLIATAAGTIKVDANEAGGSANGNQYAPAPQLQATITISTATAADVPTLLMNQIVWSYQSGTFTDGQNPAGGSFAVTPHNLIYVGTSYSNNADIVDATTGAAQKVKVNGGGSYTTDPSGNVYMGMFYTGNVYKIPYVNGAYVTLYDPTASGAPTTNNCAGDDTTVCLAATTPSGIKALAFDPTGNLYMVTTPGGVGVNAIYESTAANLTGGAATVLYTDAVGAVSQIAFDPWGNMLFTEGVYNDSGFANNDEATSSNLYELKYIAGTGFASTPVLLQTLTNTGAALHTYNNQLDGVAVTSNGTILYATQNEGTFAIPNSQANGPDAAHQYVVSSLGAKGMEVDANGNEWVVVYHSGGDNLGEALLGDLTVPTAQVNGAATTNTATVVDNGAGCSSLANLTFSSPNPEFSAQMTGNTCTTIGNTTDFLTPVSASSYGATISFSATAGGPQSATLTAVDTANGGSGSATVSGTGQETPQNLTFTSPTTATYTYSLSPTPIILSATSDGSTNPITFSVDSASTGAGVITNGNLLTFSAAGTVIIDANQTGGLVGGIFYLPATQAQLVITINQASQTITFAAPATPVAFANGLAIPLFATTTSGQTVTFALDSSSTGTGTIAGNILTVTGVGNLVIDANVAASTDYAAATPVPQTVVVNQGAQPIVFSPLASPVNYLTGLMIPLSATGGGSGNPVVFTLDANSTGTAVISTTTVTGGISSAVLVVTSQGTLVIDANQLGTANFAAATQVQQSVKIAAPLPTQAITFTNPGTQVVGTPLSLVATASSGLPVSFSTTTATVCTVSDTTVTFIAAGTCAVTAAQPGNAAYAAADLVTDSFIVNPTGVLPNVSLNLSLTSLTVQPGSVGLTQLTINSVNSFAGPVSFACSGLPNGSYCTFNPSSITVMAGQSAVTALSVSTRAATASVGHDSRPLLPAATLVAALCLLCFKKRNCLQMFLLLVIAISGLGLLSGCGGTSSSKTNPLAKSSTVTITATSGAVSQSSAFTLIVE